MKNPMKTILPEPGTPRPFPQVGGARKEPDVQTAFPLKKPQQVKDHEERKR